jgi:hypothetical protein
MLLNSDSSLPCCAAIWLCKQFHYVLAISGAVDAIRFIMLFAAVARTKRRLHSYDNLLSGSSLVLYYGEIPTHLSTSQLVRSDR